MILDGDSSVMQKMKDNGVSNPMVMNEGMDMESTITTDQIKGNIFPLRLKVLKSIITTRVFNQDTKSGIPAGTIYSGLDTLGKMPIYNSIVSDSMDEDEKSKVLKMLNSISSKLTAPDKQMGIGEEYTQNTTIPLPIAGMVLNMNFSINYKLISITDSLANFDIKTKIIITGDMQDMTPIKGTGEGGGVLVYDRKNEFPSKEELHFNIDAIIKKEQMLLKLSVGSNSSYLYTFQAR